MQPQRNLADIVQRHRAFWELAAADRPLLMLPVDVYAPTERFCATLPAGLLTPEQIDAQATLAEYDRLAAMHDTIGDDMLVTAEPVLGVPWLEAMVGCPIQVSSNGAMLAQPLPDVAAAETLGVRSDNAWLRKALDCLRAAADYAHGRFSVSVGHLRGPTDILFAALGAQSFFLACCDDPERVRRLAALATEAWCVAASAQQAVIPTYHGGSVLRWFGLWAPGPTAWLQDDASGMLSSDFYRELFLAAIGRALVFPYSIMHLHSTSLHIVDQLCDMPGLRAVNINMDPAGVPLDRAMPTLQRIQQHGKALVLSRDLYQNFTLDEFDGIVDALSPRGLCVWLDAQSIEEAQAVLAKARERCREGRRRTMSVR